MNEKLTKIMYVDDDPDMLDLVKAVLENESIEVTTLDSPTSALENIQNNAYDLVILDYFLPQIKGSTLIQQIRDFDATIPIVFFTAQSAPEEIARLKSYGANDVFIKPLKIEQLHKLLDSIPGYDIS